MTLDRTAALAEFERRRNRYDRANTRAVELFTNLLEDLGDEHGLPPGTSVIGKPKEFSSFYRKATEKYGCETIEEAFERVRDLSRVRVICQTLQDCYALVELLRRAQAGYAIDESTMEDRNGAPSKTGYRGIHFDMNVDVQVGTSTRAVPVEVQIHTALQEAWGYYTHADFYHSREAPPMIGEMMRELSDLLYWADKHASRLVEASGTQQPVPLVDGEAETTSLTGADHPPE